MSVVYPHHQVSEANLGDVVEALRQTFFEGVTLPPSFRLAQLKSLRKMFIDNKSRLIEAVQKDLGKQVEFEVLASEINLPLNELDETIKNLDKWLSPQSVSTPISIHPASSELYAEPKGTVLIMSPWNYPINLAIVPLIGAIAGGNTVLLKLSRHSINTSLTLHDLLPRYLDGRAYAIESTGGASLITKLISYKWDHIFFTGSCSVGKLVYQAAALHMTTVTLELGGKNPCIVDSNIDLDLTARRIAWGKFFNCGQTCIGVDYVLAHESIVPSLVEKLREHIENFYGSDAKTSKSYCRIISKDHAVRLSKLFDDGKVVYGGTADPEERYVAPTIILEPRENSLLLTDEIFGPVLPIVSVKNIDEAILSLRDKPLPLALYVFSKSSATAERVINNTRSGAAVHNDVIVQFLNPKLPFGGVGESGLGAYHGKQTFETFVHRKPVIKSTKYNSLDIKLRYPPYNDKSTWVVDKVTRSGL
ncbi:aldehyde dehydrogenase [Planoprotostelium fungivorum]|uniref:Aldehyde dehydrogenase n=1 Tax=Planoprotostelium fungivorum TaxID=1890364 RepID=A0A2P6NXR3_9EUKA|nr:aldehyde dehydrogenase [Planoprotostelium fungivorum]